jgi:hypothetical protein
VQGDGAVRAVLDSGAVRQNEHGLGLGLSKANGAREGERGSCRRDGASVLN